MDNKLEKKILKMTEKEIEKLASQYQLADAQVKIAKMKKAKLRETLLNVIAVKTEGSKYYTRRYLLRVNVYPRQVVNVAKLVKTMGENFVEKFMKTVKSQRLEVLRRKS